MGCDIHAYLEVGTDFEDKGIVWRGQSWRLPRNYWMFGKLAGVRGDRDENTPDPRGVPDDMTYPALAEYYDYVFDEPQKDFYEDGVSREMADRWVQEGSSVYVNDRKDIITGPDWHSASWLNREEIEKLVGNEVLEVNALLSAMKIYEEAGKKTRLVFWFDN